MTCPSCGGEVPGHKFCDQCGKPAAAGPAVAVAEPPKAVAAPQAGAASKEALACLRRGEYERAFDLLETASGSPGADTPLYDALRGVVTNRRRAGGGFSAANAYADRLELAVKLSGLGLHEEALGVVTEQVIETAAQGEDAVQVASVYAKSGKAFELVAKVANRRSGQFYTAYARAFEMLGEAAVGLDILNRKTRLDAEDYPVFFALHRRRGTLDKVDPESIPDGQKPPLAQALIEDNKEELALAVLARIPAGRWRKNEFSAALRINQRLDRFGEALALFKRIQAALPLAEAADLHYAFARFCEKHGDISRAKDIYRGLIDVIGSFKDAETRLKNIQTLTISDIGRLSSVLKSSGNEELVKSLSGLAKGKPLPGQGPGESGLIGGRYKYLEPLGAGAMGYVFLAEDMNLGRKVALKKMQAKDERAKKLLREEAKIQAKLPSTYIVPVFDYQETGGESYLVFEFIDGETLDQIIGMKGALSHGECRRMLVYICRAMAAAHAAGVIHQDLKPANIMERRTGGVMVLDFGIARHIATGGVTGGTPYYMAPEHHEGRPSIKSDLYSLGVTAYEMLTGKLPFNSGDLREYKRKERYESLPDSVPAGLRSVVEACLKADPEKRPKSARAVEGMLPKPD